MRRIFYLEIGGIFEYDIGGLFEFDEIFDQITPARFVRMVYVLNCMVCFQQDIIIFTLYSLWGNIRGH